MSTAQYAMTRSAIDQKDVSIRITSPEKPLPNRLMLLKWQNMLDFVANLFGVHASKITKVEYDSIDVVLASSKTGQLPKVRSLGAGTMDEAVISHGNTLAVEDRSMDSRWPAEEEGPVSYLGLPITWPDDEIFGTLSIEDSKINVFTDRYHKIMATFREMVNTDLSLLMKSDSYNRRSAYEDMKIKPMKTGICIYNEDGTIVSWNRSAEEILHFKAEDVLKRPVTHVFPMVSHLEENGDYNVVAGNSEMIRLTIEKTQMLSGEDAILQVLNFSDQTEYMRQLDAGMGELHRDDQSGVYDHHSITDLLNQESKRALRYGQPLSVIGLRINGYRFIEEIHGQGSTDLIVQTLAIILKNETRDVDCIGRLTEDLFVVGLPSTDRDAAKVVADRIDRIAARYSDDATPFTIVTGLSELKEAVGDWHAWLVDRLS